jgi:hypothetical protein
MGELYATVAIFTPGLFLVLYLFNAMGAGYASTSSKKSRIANREATN